MIIYQIHFTGGTFEDFFDDLVESHISLFKAEERVKELNATHEKLNELARKCVDCPYCGHYKKSLTEEEIEDAKESCPHFQYYPYEKGQGYQCACYEPYVVGARYHIRTIEVIE